MIFLAAAVLGYLLGSVSFAVIVSKLFGLADPRTVGSQNPGATNVLRSGNKLAAALTLLGDAAKGWLAMWIAKTLGAGDLVAMIGGVAALLGHIFPVMMRFKGGKGVATALGLLIGFSPVLAVYAMAVWLCVFLISGYSSLAAIVTAFTAPILADRLLGNTEVVAFVTLISLVLIARHHGNIRKLINGTESRMGRKNRHE